MRNDITALGIEPGGGALKVGQAVQLKLFAHNARGGVDLIPGNMAAWSSADNRVGEISRQGRLTPRAAGSVSITASYGDNKVAAVFTVVD